METNETKKSDLFSVDPRNIFIEDGFNTRTNFDLEGLKTSIIQFGVKQPLTCYKIKGENKYMVVDGERRLRAVMALLQEGCDIARVPVMAINKPTMEDATFLLLVKNDGKALTPIELGRTYKRLVNYGHTPDEIAAKIGKPETHVVSSLNLLQLPQEVQEAINNGQMSPTQALELTEDVGEKRAVTVVTKAKGSKIKVFKKSVILAVSRKDIEKLGYDTTRMKDEDFAIITDGIKSLYKAENYMKTLEEFMNDYEFPRK